jgi:hypothetical protein
MYHLQFSLQAVSLESFGYTLVCCTCIGHVGTHPQLATEGHFQCSIRYTTQMSQCRVHLYCPDCGCRWHLLFIRTNNLRPFIHCLKGKVILDLGTKWKWSASRPGRFTPRERAPSTHCIRRLGGLQSRSGHSGGYSV